MDRIDTLISSCDRPYINDFIGKSIAFVHAKGSSTRVASKNKRVLGDKPLFCHAICIARAANLVDAVIIDSDDDDILSIGQKYGALPLKRPRDLATNMATGDDLAYWQATNVPLSYICVQVIPTAPFLKPMSVDRAIQRLKDVKTIDSIASVYKDVFYQWVDGRPVYYKKDGSIPNSFELEPTIFETTGMYANHTKAILENKRRLNPSSCELLFLEKIETIDINTEEDFEFADIVWKGVNNVGNKD